MAISLVDSHLFRSLFGTDAMRSVFSEDALIARFVEVEVALARAQARLGVIPAAAAAAIAERARPEALDRTELARETGVVGYPILPLVHQLSALCGEAGHYLHWGATTQDVMDTAVVLQVRDALHLIEADLERVRAALAGLARRYRDTPMAGRSHLQQALPVTFGYKAAVWLSALDRHADRLAELRPRVLVGQFGGAVGTLASLGADGVAVHRALMLELGLGEPAIAWHVVRDGPAETVQVLALIAGSLGKIACDVMLLMGTETGEVFEPYLPGRGASSTMPQKRNPIACEVILGVARIVRQHAGLMLDAMVQDLERATGPWPAEALALPESFALTAAALHHARLMLEGLEVDERRMAANLALTDGLIAAEAVMMGLAPQLGRGRAHDLVYEACRKARAGRRTLHAVLAEDAEVVERLGADRLARLTDPANYLGAAREMVDRLLADRPRPAAGS
ncbi:class-II fumarase/aspartase family protein [Azospirillum sp. ST 5-10]|uniref:class-II fumarase/aspartase family protein n=1 Tax=unclassified Azospirillum TaxID=2630922 RepID=UPI003F4A6724